MIQVLQTFALEHEFWFVFVSLVLNVGLSLLIVVPSAFLTTTNVVVFGPVLGFWLSFAGEALGAIISFWLYRTGLSKVERLQAAPWVAKLENESPLRQMGAVFGLRLLPFVPSGLVTVAAALVRMSLVPFAVASSIGKLPALMLEVLGVSVLLEAWTKWGNVWLFLLASLIGFMWWWRRRPRPVNE